MGCVSLSFLPRGKSFVFFSLILFCLYDSLICVGGSCVTNQAEYRVYRYKEGFKRRKKLDTVESE